MTPDELKERALRIRYTPKELKRKLIEEDKAFKLAYAALLSCMTSPSINPLLYPVLGGMISRQFV